MATKRQQPTREQWAQLDVALNDLRDKPPANVAPPLAQAIAKRADAIRTVLASGWRVRDLAAFFKQAAGIDVSATTIQTALRQAPIATETATDRTRAKRPRKRRTSENASAPQPEHGLQRTETVVVQSPLGQQGAKTQTQHGNDQQSTILGENLTQGARKRGQR
ncbi:hypothetical protein [Ralstonia sp. 1138]|uniref:hypothetical protein n=1 Tax=Ralstonia sp. 1138 TaxID=3156423 RepID=UPI003394430A